MNNRQKAILKMLKEAKRRISIDKEIVEVCTKELEQFYADQEVEHIIEQDDVIFRRVNSTYWKYPNELRDEVRLLKEKAQLNGTATQEQSSTWRMVEVRHENDSDIF